MDITAIGERKIDWPTKTTYGVGPGVVSGAAAYVTAVHRGIYPGSFLTELRFTALPVVTGNATGASFGSKQIFTFPEGRLRVDNVNAYFSSITMNTAAGAAGDIAADGAGSGDFSMGSTATADATLGGTDVDLLPSTAMLDPFVAGVGRSNAWATLVAAAVFDGTSTPLSLYLNVIIDDADVADGAANDNVYFTGYTKIIWTFYGDNVTEIPALPA
jgi:hypothetical protein